MGLGTDLGLVRARFHQASLTGIDCVADRGLLLEQQGISARAMDLKRDPLPFEDEILDLIIANQVLEHVKELFWIMHQVSLKLRRGGHLIVGVPNMCALHNRVAFVFGGQPSQLKPHSAHVRGFAPGEIARFLSVCWPGGYRVEMLRGAQVYPFPRRMSRRLPGWFPSLALTIFYLVRKVAPYQGEFLRHPVEAQLETPFFLG